MDTAPPSDPLLPSPMPAFSVSAPPAALSAVVLPAVTVTAPPGPVLPSPTLREIAPPAPPVAMPVSTVNAPVAPVTAAVPVVSVMLPLTPLEPESAVAIGGARVVRSSDAARHTHGAARVAPRPPSMDTAPPSDPLLPSPMPAVSVSAPPAALSAVVLPAVTVTAPPGPVLPSPTLREIAPPRPVAGQLISPVDPPEASRSS